MKRILPILISIIALIISCYAAFVCDKRIEADWMGVLVGVLSLLVTAVIGVNIYTIVDFNRATKEVKRLKNEIDKQETEIYAQSEKNLIEFYMSVFLMYISKEDKDYKDSYQIVLSGLSAMIHQSRIGLYDQCEITARSILVEKEIISMLKISKLSKEALLKMMLDIKDAHRIGCYYDLLHALCDVVPIH